MDSSIRLSIIALLISLGGVGISLWATLISKHSLDHALQVQQRQDDEDFEKLRMEVLMQISDTTEIMRQYSIQLNIAKMKYDNEPEPVKKLMKNYADLLFTQYLTSVGVTMQRLDNERKTVLSYSQKNDYKKLMGEKAQLYQGLKANEAVRSSVQNVINEFNVKLKMAELDAKQ